MTDWLAKIGFDESAVNNTQNVNTGFLIAKAIIYLADTISKSISDAATKISGRLP
jgi:hypothetical protein